MKCRPIILVILLLMICAQPVLSQEYSYSHYDVKEGLPASTIYCMAEDKEGFLWFGTENGLSRFDGTYFTNFTTADGLPDNEVLKLFVDSHNRVWMVPFLNSVAYYWKGKIYTSRNDSILAQLHLRDNIINITEDPAGNILVLERYRVDIIDPAGHISTISTFNGSPFAANLAGLNQHHGFRVQVAQGFGLQYSFSTSTFDIDSGKVHPLGTQSVKVGFAGGPNFMLFGSSLRVTNQNGYFLYYDSLDHFVFRLPVPRDFISLSALDDSSIALNTQRGVFLLSIPQRKIIDTFLKGQAVNATIRDAEGSFWLSTLGQGVFRLGSTEFRNYSPVLQGNNQPVFSISPVDSSLYAGGDHFLLGKFSRNRKEISYKQADGGNSSKATRGRIMAILGSSLYHTVILGTDDGVFFLDHQSGQKISFHSIKSMAQRDDSTLVAFSGQCLVYFSLRDLHIVADSRIMERTTCGTIQGKTIYFGALDGLHRVDSNSMYGVYLGDKDPLLKNRIAGMAVSADGILWLATYGQGLVGYKEGKVVAHISQEDGLTSNICRTVFADSMDVWVGTDKGLNEVKRSGRTKMIIPYTTGDGLNSDIINTIYVEGRQVYAGTSAGLISFDDSRIGRVSECKLHFTAIHAGEQKWAFDTTDFVVPNQNNNLQFEFSGISFKSGGSITYQFRLKGLSDKWQTTRTNFLNYPALPSGSYDLEIVAINKFGVHSVPAHVHFTVEKAFLEKTWVRICIVALIGGLVWAGFTLRVKRLRQKEAEKTETVARMAELEQMALRSQMNPHFIFNCLNSIQEYVLDRDVLGANDFITKFSNLIRQTLDLSSRPFISVHEEITYISTYLELEKKRFGNKFIYEIRVNKTIDRHEGHIPPMILQPYVENAIRHGIGNRQDKNGKILLSMDLVGSYLICIVEDNGVGRQQAGKYKKNAIHYQSKGMSLVEKRVGMFNRTSIAPIVIEVEDLNDTTGEPCGTRITIRFPYEA